MRGRWEPRHSHRAGAIDGQPKGARGRRGPPRATRRTVDPYRKPGRWLSICEVGSARRAHVRHAHPRLSQRQIDPPRQVDPRLPAEHASHTLPRHTSRQDTPHTPQWFGSAASGVSHPSPSSPLQSPKPASQAATRHCPASQRAVARDRRHARPQPPQWARSPRVSTSQPSPGRTRWPDPSRRRTARRTPARRPRSAGTRRRRPARLARGAGGTQRRAASRRASAAPSGSPVAAR